jgi:glycosyltransferase involved in cell wall biosynthesis
LDIEKLPYRLDFVVNPTQDELRKIYSNANVFVGAETHSGWGNCTVEAMACGTPVVCTESGTGDFAVHGMNALISERGPEEIAYHVDRLLRDLDLRVKFSVGGKEVVKQFTWDRVCDKLERIVHGPLNNNSGKE